MFIELAPEQEVAFRQWARENYKPGADINSMWHPVVQDECQQISTKKCICGATVTVDSFTDDVSRKDFYGDDPHRSGMCQVCQDEIYGEGTK